MESSVASKALYQFQAPGNSLGDLDAEVAARLIAAAADIALIVDADGIIRDLAFGGEELSNEGYGEWIGRPWLDTVTVESRPKVEALLREAGSEPAPKWRQVNHPSPSGLDVPVLYSAIQLGKGGRIVAVGRDLRAIANLQQRLVQAQQSMEREYARLRHAETRYRLLFQIAAEAVVIVDAANQRIVEVNPAAAELLDVSARKLPNRPLAELFAPESLETVRDLLAQVRTGRRVEDAKALLAEGRRPLTVSASLFRQENASHVLLRLTPVGGESAGPRSKSDLASIVEQMPDGFVVTATDFRVLTANSAFLELAQLATEEQARGQPLERWLGRPGIDLGLLAATLKEHGSVRNFSTVLRGEYGITDDVVISAVSVFNGEQPCFGLTIRSAAQKPAGEPKIGRELPRSVEQMTELVGRMPLKDLVRETTDLIERLSIEAALELTGDNRASAAEMLGLSRQSLYVKMRRYGLGDLDSEDEA